ncbi:unnamed protein product [Bursaphelenchus xylophilus]|uniref:(pine wood nematode) hypothetical protein n=1 Tax=Bursaphelenchus xylophilus TaxID=6326 RepID=A0A811LWI3_BURXY|nr:unnamed protein product [Bursaphelenchus xylophilus]CAG9125810.1 unnamed protein product [Bursaphelenchus xylophilus]
MSNTADVKKRYEVVRVLLSAVFNTVKRRIEFNISPKHAPALSLIHRATRRLFIQEKGSSDGKTPSHRKPATLLYFPDSQYVHTEEDWLFRKNVIIRDCKISYDL